MGPRLTRPDRPVTPPADGGAFTGPRRFRPDVQGLRAVSVILVVLYHARVAAVSGGYVGVDVFFVISGFLITDHLVAELAANATLSLRSFYAARARRILPAAMLVAAVTLVVSLIVLAPLPARRVAGDTVAAGAYVINYRLAARQTNYFASSAPPSPLQHYWSLAVEEQFYLVWPLVLLIAWRWRRRQTLAAAMALIFVASLAGSVWLTHHDAPWAYFSLLTRAWELAAGGLLATFGRRWSPRGGAAGPAAALGLLAIAGAAHGFGATTAYPGVAAAVPVGGAVLVLWSGIAGGGLRALGAGPLRRIGDVSYSWYLWHFPALILLPVLLGHALSFWASLGVALVTLALAAVTYVAVENPIRYWTALRRRPLRSIASGLSLSAATVAAALLAAAALPTFASPAGATTTNPPLGVHDGARLSTELAGAASVTRLPPDLIPSLGAASDDLPLIYRDGCNVSYTGTRSPTCEYGDVHSTTTVVLFGDSHGAMWFPAMSAISSAEHWRLYSFTKLACPAVDVPMFNTTLERRYVECTDWLHATEARIVALHPAVVVVASMRSYTDTSLAPSKAAFDAAWGAGTVDVLRRLRASGATVVMLQDIPLPAGSVPDCLSGHPDAVPACSVTALAATNQPARRAAEPGWAALAGVARIDPTPWLCDRVCPPVVGDLLVYRDDSHMTPQYATWISPLLLGALVRAAPALGSG